jgi:hypothetical protein
MGRTAWKVRFYYITTHSSWGQNVGNSAVIRKAGMIANLHRSATSAKNGGHRFIPPVRELLQTSRVRLCHGEDGVEGPLLLYTTHSSWEIHHVGISAVIRNTVMIANLVSGCAISAKTTALNVYQRSVSSCKPRSRGYVTGKTAWMVRSYYITHPSWEHNVGLLAAKMECYILTSS